MKLTCDCGNEIVSSAELHRFPDLTLHDMSWACGCGLQFRFNLDFKDIAMKEACKHPEHSAPSGITLQTNEKYYHTCPSCLSESVFVNRSATPWQAQP